MGGRDLQVTRFGLVIVLLVLLLVACDAPTLYEDPKCTFDQTTGLTECSRKQRPFYLQPWFYYYGPGIAIIALILAIPYGLWKAAVDAAARKKTANRDQPPGSGNERRF